MGLSTKFSGKWVVKPTSYSVHAYEGFIDWNGAPRGAYDNRVSSHIDGTTLYSVVRGRQAQQHVIVKQTDRHNLEPQCDCDMSDYFLCDHIVIALRHLADNFEELTTDSYSRKERIGAMLAAITPDQALGFLAKTLADDPDVYTQFEGRFKMKGKLKSDRDYGMSVDRLYYMSMNSAEKVVDGLAFDDFFNSARASASAVESVRIHKAVSEAILRNMKMVDNTDGYYTDCLAESLENMVEFILKLDGREEHVSYLAGMILKAPRDMARHYRAALESVCESQVDAQCLHAVSRELLASDGLEPWQVAELTRLCVHALEEGAEAGQGGRTQAALNSLAETYKIDSDLRIMYIRLLGRIAATAAATTTTNGAAVSDIDGARQTAERILEEFPDDEAAARAVLDAEIFDREGPRYAELATRLFASTCEWKYYTRLRESASWNADDVIQGLLDAKHDKLVLEVCVKEKMYDRAMDLLESKKNLALFAEYVTKVGKKDPRRYFAAYASRIREFASRSGGKKTKRGIGAATAKILKRLHEKQQTDVKYNAQLREHLLAIKELGDNDMYAELVMFARSKNIKNASLLAALRDL